VIDFILTIFRYVSEVLRYGYNANAKTSSTSTDIVMQESTDIANEKGMKKKGMKKKTRCTVQDLPSQAPDT